MNDMGWIAVAAVAALIAGYLGFSYGSQKSYAEGSANGVKGERKRLKDLYKSNPLKFRREIGLDDEPDDVRVATSSSSSPHAAGLSKEPIEPGGLPPGSYQTRGTFKEGGTSAWFAILQREDGSEFPIRLTERAHSPGFTVNRDGTVDLKMVMTRSRIETPAPAFSVVELQPEPVQAPAEPETVEDTRKRFGRRR